MAGMSPLPGWQVTLCDPIWHVSSRSGAVLVAQTAIRFLTSLPYYCRIGLPANHHHQLQETWHISLPFVSTEPGADLASPNDTKLLNRSGPFFWRIVPTPDILRLHLHLSSAKKDIHKNLPFIPPSPLAGFVHIWHNHPPLLHVCSCNATYKI